DDRRIQQAECALRQDRLDGVDRPLLGERRADTRNQRERAARAGIIVLLPDAAHTRSSGGTGSTTQLGVTVRNSRFRGRTRSKPKQPGPAARVDSASHGRLARLQGRTPSSPRRVPGLPAAGPRLCWGCSPCPPRAPRPRPLRAAGAVAAPSCTDPIMKQLGLAAALLLITAGGAAAQRAEPAAAADAITAASIRARLEFLSHDLL